MEKLLIVPAVMLGGINISHAQYFRDFTWGKSPDNVQSGEKAALAAKVKNYKLIQITK